MSDQDANAFAKKVMASKDLLAKVTALKGSIDQMAAELVTMGSAEKLNFSAAEIKAVAAKILGGGNELSDSDLENVAGGAGLPPGFAMGPGGKPQFPGGGGGGPRPGGGGGMPPGFPSRPGKPY